MLKVVSFYTNARYRDAATVLTQSLRALDMGHHVEEIPDRGAWLKNCRIKPSFVNRMLYLYPTHNILYLDCDAKVHQPLSFFETETGFDIAVHRSDKGSVWGGTIFVRNNDIGRLLTRVWSGMTDELPIASEDLVLEKHVLNRADAKVKYLPKAYCWYGKTSHNTNEPKPVIEHYFFGHPGRK
jgi:hypothetical protein